MANLSCLSWELKIHRPFRLNVGHTKYTWSNTQKKPIRKTSFPVFFVVSRCLREQECVWDPGHWLAAYEDLPKGDAEEDPSEHLGWVLPSRGQTLSSTAAVGRLHPFRRRLAAALVLNVVPSKRCSESFTWPWQHSAHASAVTRGRWSSRTDVYSVNVQRGA